jgi:hypothetical protein
MREICDCCNIRRRCQSRISLLCQIVRLAPVYALTVNIDGGEYDADAEGAWVTASSCGVLVQVLAQRTLTCYPNINLPKDLAVIDPPGIS